MRPKRVGEAPYPRLEPLRAIADRCSALSAAGEDLLKAPVVGDGVGRPVKKPAKYRAVLVRGACAPTAAGAGVYAVSDDGGATWRDASGRTAIRVGAGRSIRPDDAHFRVAGGHIGLFKGLVAGPDGPTIVYSHFRRDRADVFRDPAARRPLAPVAGGARR